MEANSNPPADNLKPRRSFMLQLNASFVSHEIPGIFTKKGHLTMKTNLILKNPIAALMLLSSVLFHPSSSPASGSLTPPGSPAPTMKSLQEIEPRTLIASAPVTISAPGSYYLSNNITVSSGTAITIASSGVTLDLNGFTISSTAASATGYGVLISGASNNIAILNGFVKGGVTDNGSGTFSGPGFAYGIYGNNASNVRVCGVGVSGCLTDGIFLNQYGPTIVEGCTVRTVGSYGINANVVKSSSAYDCGNMAVNGYQVSDSSGQSPYIGDGLRASQANNCYGESVGPDSHGLIANLANNCYGTTINGDYGLNAATAINCYGEAYNTNNVGLSATDCTGCYGYGGSIALQASGTANGCYGESQVGYGIYAGTAENCYGSSLVLISGSTHYAGIYANTAHNCYGYSYFDFGIQAVAVNNCYGSSTYNYGIYGFDSTTATAENSYGYSGNGIGMVVHNAINCTGESQSGGIGLDAYVANNCFGLSHGGYYGLYATVANNCFGYDNNPSGFAETYGIVAYIANNCYGYTSSSGNYGYGVSASSINNCYGYSSSPYGYGLSGTIVRGSIGYDYATGGYGLSAYIAESSYANSETGISYKWNMP